MGAWGVRLTEDDFAADIVSEYFELFDKGEAKYYCSLEINNDGLCEPDADRTVYYQKT